MLGCSDTTLIPVFERQRHADLCGFRPTCLEACAEIRTLIYCFWEYKLIQPIWRFLRKLKIKLVIWPRFATPGHTRNNPHILPRKIVIHVYCSPIHNSKKNVPDLHVHQLTNKNVLHGKNRMLFNYKEKWNFRKVDGLLKYNTKWCHSNWGRKRSHVLCHMQSQCVTYCINKCEGGYGTILREQNKEDWCRVTRRDGMQPRAPKPWKGL